MPVLPVPTSSLTYVPSFRLALSQAVDSAYCTNPGKLITADSHPQFFQEGDRIAARVAAGGGMTASCAYRDRSLNNERPLRMERTAVY